jgi:hypothetical protein
MLYAYLFLVVSVKFREVTQKSQLLMAIAAMLVR